MTASFSFKKLPNGNDRRKVKDDEEFTAKIQLTFRRLFAREGKEDKH